MLHFKNKNLVYTKQQLIFIYGANSACRFTKIIVHAMLGINVKNARQNVRGSIQFIRHSLGQRVLSREATPFHGCSNVLPFVVPSP